ncbi:hypothetical protein ACFSE0_10585 [Ochrobactrum teleogrylli]|uniref:Uncharacterized protein n=1 Tax=Ochrobactrum teleogrylli TaxID=2479765 RepID=A0ABY2YAI2_9HYPH|nr:hypothetical protein [[Ochrobactrum] teleogrylli]TNV17743.1 hypothetical protein FIC94_06085 [[Ochrobactrum] teleogrylli]
MPATRDLDIPSRNGIRFGYPVKAGIRFFGRAIVAVTAAGLAVPAGHADAVAIGGLAEFHVDNRDGADGDLIVTAIRDTRGFEFDADYADIGKAVYATDDATLTLDGTGGALKLGIIAGLGDDRTWVSVGA